MGIIGFRNSRNQAIVYNRQKKGKILGSNGEVITRVPRDTGICGTGN